MFFMRLFYFYGMFVLCFLCFYFVFRIFVVFLYVCCMFFVCLQIIENNKIPQKLPNTLTSLNRSYISITSLFFFHVFFHVLCFNVFFSDEKNIFNSFFFKFARDIFKKSFQISILFFSSFLLQYLFLSIFLFMKQNLQLPTDLSIYTHTHMHKSIYTRTQKRYYTKY